MPTKFLFMLTAFCLFLFPARVLAQEDVKEKTDQQRICDIIKIAGYVEEYKLKVGFYPYGEAYLNPTEGYTPVPGSVVIYRGELPERYLWPPRGRSGKVFSIDNFEKNLSVTLGDIKLPVDGRIVNETSFPTFYQYLFDGEAYYVSAILKKERDDTRTLAPGFYKYEVSSIGIPERKIQEFGAAKDDCNSDKSQAMIENSN